MFTAGNAIGLEIPDTQGTWSGGGGTNPGDLGEDLRAMQLTQFMTRHSALNSKAPVNKGCN